MKRRKRSQQQPIFWRSTDCLSQARARPARISYFFWNASSNTAAGWMSPRQSRQTRKLGGKLENLSHQSDGACAAGPVDPKIKRAPDPAHLNIIALAMSQFDCGAVHQ